MSEQPNASPAKNSHAPVDPKLLELLVCPLTKSTLHYDRDRNELVSEQARLAYPIRDGIPIMLVDEARSLDDAA
ncbi:Trm112 family protein [Ferrovibrio sp.]|uniref:Trm112 family protein n=1 Tax=Ferrovibrio sp. TaxID=1917215 RepID=UPI0025B87FD4|nr:Trm112 family protein [Ferrovibrio sp.]MBX3456537.1 Trm112 family protein [Ferrovibrio sp.]